MLYEEMLYEEMLYEEKGELYEEMSSKDKFPIRASCQFASRAFLHLLIILRMIVTMAVYQPALFLIRVSFPHATILGLRLVACTPKSNTPLFDLK